MNKRLQRRIQLIQNLINHKNTSPEEKASAQHALQRLQENNPTDWAATAPTGHIPDMFVGSRYTSGQDIADIAKILRAEFRLRRKMAKKTPDTNPTAPAILDPIGDLPDDIKISVTIDRFSGGQAIDIRLKNVPDDWFTTEQWHGHPTRRATPRLKAVAQELNNAVQAFNFDGSDSQIDYFHVNFYSHVTVNGTTIA